MIYAVINAVTNRVINVIVAEASFSAGPNTFKVPEPTAKIGDLYHPSTGTFTTPEQES